MSPEDLLSAQEAVSAAGFGELSDQELEAVAGGKDAPGKLIANVGLAASSGGRNPLNPFKRWGSAGPYQRTGPVSSLTRRGVLG